MPLNMSCTQEAVSENIAREIKRGRKPEQAKAIAMSTLARACGLSVLMQKKARRENWSVKKIIAMGKRFKNNPYPLLIATLANPEQYKNIPEAIKCFRESHGTDADMRFETANIQGLAEGSVWIYQGMVKYLIYNSGKVVRTIKGQDDWEHTVGDGVKEVVYADLYYNVEKTAMLIIVRDKNGKILKTIKEGFLNERQE